ESLLGRDGRWRVGLIGQIDHPLDGYRGVQHIQRDSLSHSESSPRWSNSSSTVMSIGPIFRRNSSDRAKTAARLAISAGDGRRPNESISSSVDPALTMIGRSIAIVHPFYRRRSNSPIRGASLAKRLLEP